MLLKSCQRCCRRSRRSSCARHSRLCKERRSPHYLPTHSISYRRLAPSRSCHARNARKFTAADCAQDDEPFDRRDARPRVIDLYDTFRLDGAGLDAPPTIASVQRRRTPKMTSPTHTIGLHLCLKSSRADAIYAASQTRRLYFSAIADISVDGHYFSLLKERRTLA